MNFNNHQELIDDIREWATNDEISYRNWIQPTIILWQGRISVILTVLANGRKLSLLSQHAISLVWACP